MAEVPEQFLSARIVIIGPITEAGTTRSVIIRQPFDGGMKKQGLETIQVDRRFYLHS